MSSSVTESNLEKKFQSVSNTQDSIQTLSLWILHHRAHHQKIVHGWMKALQKSKTNHRLTLFYLANDVIQNAKRKGISHYGNAFSEVLREATLLVRDAHIKSSVQRVFDIWEQRSVYDSDFIADLQAILANAKVPATAQSKLLAEFKLELVVQKIRLVKKLDSEVVAKMSTVNLSKLNATNAEIVQQLKDRNHGQQFSRDFDESTKSLEELIKVMEKCNKERHSLVMLLDQSEIYYESQKGEAKLVANAYKSFGARIKTLQKKLDELRATFPSPVPSPCLDAPSPTSETEMELELPNSNNNNDADNLDNVPSPEGTPEGLNLPDGEEDEKKVQHALAGPPPAVGNPIPTLSNFFTKEKKGMSSWLDSFSNKTQPVPEKGVQKSADASSLDNRLSSLLQNIPNLPAGLHNTLFGTPDNTTPSRDILKSPVRNSKEKVQDTPPSYKVEMSSPSKDDYSGQNTPLQDEDTHPSHQTSFLTKLSSSAQNSKEILQGLTNYIHSNRERESRNHQKSELYAFESPDLYDGRSSMPSFIKKIAPSVPESSQISSSPSSYYNSPGNNIHVFGDSTMHSYQTPSYRDMTTYSTAMPPANVQENLSFIPSVVPSASFNYMGDPYQQDAYNPETQEYADDIDVDNSVEADVPCPDLVPSPVPSLSPPPCLPRMFNRRRHSTLITVVMKESPLRDSVPEDKPYSTDMFDNTDKNEFKPEKPTPEAPIIQNEAPALKTDEPSPKILKVSPEETPEVLMDKDERILPPPPLPPMIPEKTDYVSTNGNVSPVKKNSTPSPKIEMSEPHRQIHHSPPDDSKIFGNKWTDFEDDDDDGTIPQPPHHGQKRPFEGKRGQRSSNFHPRNNWQHRDNDLMFRPRGPMFREMYLEPPPMFRERPMFFRHRFGPPMSPPPRMRMPFRGRGWGPRMPHY